MNYIKTLALLLLALLNGIAFAQFETDAKIENVDFKIKDADMVINFDLTGTNNADKFYIRLRIENEAGQEIAAKTVTGDINKDVRLGVKKEIRWDLKTDKVVIDYIIRIALFANLQIPSDQVVPLNNVTNNAIDNVVVNNNVAVNNNNANTELENKEPVNNNQTGNELSNTENNSNANNFQQIKVKSISGSLFLSTLWPGWGTARYGSGANALWGLIGYGCLGGAAYFGYDAFMVQYPAYAESNSASRTDDYYSIVKKDVEMLQYLAIGAAAVWGIEYIRVIAKGSKAKKKARESQLGGFSPELTFVPSYNSTTKSLQAGLNIRF